MPEALILRLAVLMPEAREGLKSAGMTPYLLSSYSEGILAALRRARSAKPISPDSRPRNRRDPKEFKLFEALRMWRKAKAAEMGIDPVAIVSSEELRAVARIAVQNGADPLKDLSEFKRSRYGDEILRALRP